MRDRPRYGPSFVLTRPCYLRCSTPTLARGVVRYPTLNPRLKTLESIGRHPIATTMDSMWHTIVALK